MRVTSSYRLSLPTVDVLSDFLTRFLFVAVGVGLFFVSGQLRIEFVPVPFTMQTAVVLLLGLVYPYRLGMYTMMTCYSLTILGFPICAGFSSGLTPFMSYSAGYLYAFYYVTIFLHVLEPFRRGAGVGVWVLHAFIAQSFIWLSGFFGMIYFGMSWQDALFLGVFPYVMMDIVKLFISVWVARKLVLQS